MSESPRDVVVLGAGGHARVLIDLMRVAGALVPVAILDRDPAFRGSDIAGVPVIGDDTELDQFAPNHVSLVNGVGSTANTTARRIAFIHGKGHGFRFVTLVHPRAVVASDAQLGEGTQVMAGAVINTCAVVGDDAIVNTRAVVEHDCRVGDHTHVASGAVLAGGVILGDGVHVGAGATVIQNVSVGSGSVIGAGAVVIRDVPRGVTVVGVPARIRESLLQ